MFITTMTIFPILILIESIGLLVYFQKTRSSKIKQQYYGTVSGLVNTALFAAPWAISNYLWGRMSGRWLIVMLALLVAATIVGLVRLPKCRRKYLQEKAEAAAAETETYT